MRKVTEEMAEKREVDYEDKLNRCAWKLQGVAGLFFIDEAVESITLYQDQARGISFLLEGIADDILVNTEKIQGVTT